MYGKFLGYLLIFTLLFCGGVGDLPPIATDAKLLLCLLICFA